MSAQTKFVTIQEAVNLTKKSEKTIRRLVKGLVTENRVTGQVTSQDIEKLRVENKNGKHFYALSWQFLAEQYGMSGQNQTVSGHSENLSGQTTSQTTGQQQETTGHVSGHPENMTGQTTSQEEKTAQLRGLERYVGFLEEQVRVKDGQIKNFQERDKEHNILINRLQEQVFLLEEGKPESRREYGHEHIIYQHAPAEKAEEGSEGRFETAAPGAYQSDENSSAHPEPEEIPADRHQEGEDLNAETPATAAGESAAPATDTGTEAETLMMEEGLAAAEAPMPAEGEPAAAAEQPDGPAGIAAAPEIVMVIPHLPAQPLPGQPVSVPPPVDAAAAAAGIAVSEEPATEITASAVSTPMPASGEQGAGEGSDATVAPVKKRGFWRRVFGG